MRIIRLIKMFVIAMVMSMMSYVIAIFAQQFFIKQY